MNPFPSLAPAPLLAGYCVLVGLASLAGGWLLLGLRLTHARLQLVVSFVAGLMLSLALLHFIPHALHQNHSLEATARWTLLGFLLMFLLQRFFPHHHHDVAAGAPETQVAAGGPTLAERSARQLSWVATTVGMGLHSLVGGVALAAALAADTREPGSLVGFATALTIILHKPFDALAVTTLLAASGGSRRARHWLNGLFALITPLGAVLFQLGTSAGALAHPAFLGTALAFCAGTFLCIAGSDLLPELQFHSHDRGKLSLALLAGVGVTLLIAHYGHAVH